MATGITLAHSRFVPPAAANFTAVGTNSETPTLTDDAQRGLVFAYGSSPAGGDNVRYAYKAPPASSNYDVIARFRASPLGFSFYIYGFVVSDGTKAVTLGCTSGGNGYRFAIDKWNTTQSYNGSSISSQNAPGREYCEWMKLGIVSGAPQQFSVSHNGKDWVRIFDTSLSSFLTYTRVGFGLLVTRNGNLLPVASTPQAFMDVMYWADPDIVPAV